MPNGRRSRRAGVSENSAEFHDRVPWSQAWYDFHKGSWWCSAQRSCMAILFGLGGDALSDMCPSGQVGAAPSSIEECRKLDPSEDSAVTRYRRDNSTNKFGQCTFWHSWRMLPQLVHFSIGASPGRRRGVYFISKSVVYRALVTRAFPRCFLSICKDVRLIMPVLSCANVRPSFSTHSRATGGRYRSRRSILWSCCAWCLSSLLDLWKGQRFAVHRMACNSGIPFSVALSALFTCLLTPSIAPVTFCLRLLPLLRQSSAFRKLFLYAKTCKPGCRRCLMRQSSAHILRHLNSPVLTLGCTVDTCPSSWRLVEFSTHLSTCLRSPEKCRFASCGMFCVICSTSVLLPIVIEKCSHDILLLLKKI